MAVAATLSLVSAACGGNSGDDTDEGAVASSSRSTTTTVAGAAAGMPSGSSVATATTAKGGKSASTTTTTPSAASSPTSVSGGGATNAGSGGDAGTGSTSGAPTLPPSGRSTYRATGTHTSGTGPTAKTEKIDRMETDDVTVTPVPGGHEVKVVTQAGDEQRQSLYRVTDTSMVLLELQTTNARGTTVIRPNPPMTVALFPLTVGRTWPIQWRDDATTVQSNGTGTVARTERIGRVDTTVVELRQQLSGPVSGRFDVDAWADPSTGRQLRQHYVIDIQLGANRDVVDLTRELS